MSDQAELDRADDSILSERVFWQFWLGSTISLGGYSIGMVAIPVVALHLLDASAFRTSLLSAAFWAGWLLIGLPAGVLVQRYPLRGTQVAMDLARAVAVGTVPLAWFFGGLTFEHLLAVTLIVSLANVVFSTGNSTFLPRIVPRELLMSKNGILSGTQAISQFGAPALGGLLVAAVGPMACLGVNALSYLFSSALLRGLPRAQLRVSHKAADASVRPRVSMVAGIREGLVYVFHDPILRPCVLAAAALNFACGVVIATIPLFVIREIGRSGAVVGFVMATEGIGSLIGAAAVGWVVSRLGSARVARLSLYVSLAGALLMPFAIGAPALLVFCVANVIFTTGVIMFGVVTRTHRQLETPPELLARVMATVRFVSWGVIPVGAVTAGAVATIASPSSAFLAVLASSLLAAAFVRTSRVSKLTSLESDQTVRSQ